MKIPLDQFLLVANGIFSVMPTFQKWGKIQRELNYAMK